TRFMATKEAPIHENVKQALIKSDELNTKLIMRTLRNTERTLHNTVVDKVLEVESRGNTTIEDLIPFVSGLGGKKMLEEGDLESGILSAGQSMGFVHDIPTVQELMDRIMKQAEDIIKEKFTQVISPT
ncbi:MAG: nitronate monooxygenase, partial [Deltaproteobacteria bacterium]|nr:nitronate monooxygenase [Deltaproteobacteria bacterium]